MRYSGDETDRGYYTVVEYLEAEPTETAKHRCGPKEWPEGLIKQKVSETLPWPESFD